MSLYSVRLLVHLRSYRVVKFDEHFDVERTPSNGYAIYNIHRYGLTSPWRCTCPRAQKSPLCRHRDIVTLFINEKKVDSGWFYDFDKQAWERPVNDIIRMLEQRRLRCRT